MLRIGIIGAGSLSSRHINAYRNDNRCTVTAIADINPEQLKKTADELGIEKRYSDYRKLLDDTEIDAVSIVTPTFTHKEICLYAIEKGKHILCEKPPAMNADEVKEVAAALDGYDKVFMYAMVCRFNERYKYVKNFIDSGKMGQPICAEAVRTAKLSAHYGWFARSELGGGMLRDSAIHEIDLVLYALGYPRAVSVTAFRSDINNSLPSKMKSGVSGYVSADKSKRENNTEDIINAFVMLENGVNLTVKTGAIRLADDGECRLTINGEKAGVTMSVFGEAPVKVTEVTEDGYLQISSPMLSTNNAHNDETVHFIDCCCGVAECTVKPYEAVRLMELIDAVYESAKTGETVIIK